MKKNALVIGLLFLAGLVSAQANLPVEDDFTLLPLATNLGRPWSVAFLPDQGALITLKPGSLLYLAPSGDLQEIQGLPALDSSGQGGLLDLTLDPEFAENSLIYFSYSKSSSQGKSTAVYRARLELGTRSLRDGEIIFTGSNYSRGGNHYGSRIQFDPQGRLWVTLGERNERNQSQNATNHFGVMVRMDRQGNPLGVQAEDQTGRSFDSYVVSYGHRNAQGMAIHPGDGRVWIHEHGPRGGDEINLILAGSNYGWPLTTHGREYSGAQVGQGLVSAPGITDPLHQWTPSIAPSGMEWYTGEEFPQWQGDLFVGALAGKALVRVRFTDVEGERPRYLSEEEYLVGWNRIRDVVTNAAGELFILTDGTSGGLYQLVPR